MSAVEVTEGSVKVEMCGPPLFYPFHPPPPPPPPTARPLPPVRRAEVHRPAAARDPLLLGELAPDPDPAHAGCGRAARPGAGPARAAGVRPLVHLVSSVPPGLGQSKAAEAPAPVGQPAPGEFLRQVCEALQTGPVVVISPSLSGMYSLPFLFQHTQQVKAYIPVAPICTDKFKAEQYASIQVPTLIIYGDQDTQLGEVSLRNLSNLPNHRVVVMKGAGHPCYLDDPETWHKSILEFLQGL
ncbi:hypothetical protein NFI96_026284 [Prochilodus magdalenae]|nr:hypothetical protein NFI96_026284 [Prochilodus magdalenae]